MKQPIQSRPFPARDDEWAAIERMAQAAGFASRYAYFRIVAEQALAGFPEPKEKK